MNEAGEKFKLIATTRCGSCGCGCPAVLETETGDELVIVGKLDDLVARASAVREHVGEGEMAVVIPKSLLLEAAKLLA